jgi:membrane protein
MARTSDAKAEHENLRPGDEPPQPQPEHRERTLADPGPRDLSRRDWAAVVKRSLKEAKDDQITDAGAALAYYGFLAIPSLLLVAVGVFTIAAGPNTVTTMMSHLKGIVPQQTITLLDESLRRQQAKQSGGLALTIIGFVLALWSCTGAMTAIMRALNRAYDREETRGFVRQRLAALAMIVCALLAFGLAFGLLVLGPQLSGWVGSALGIQTAMQYIWWIGQWPILIVGLLLAFAGLYYFGPNVEHPRWSFLSVGSVVAVLIWLAASGGFAVYVSMFGSYNKTWGSLAAVIIMLTWLWLSGLALLLGAEINAEAERSRELRRGERAETDLTAPAKA